MYDVNILVSLYLSFYSSLYFLGRSFSMVCIVKCVGVSKDLWGVLNVPGVSDVEVVGVFLGS